MLEKSGALERNRDSRVHDRDRKIPLGIVFRGNDFDYDHDRDSTCPASSNFFFDTTTKPPIDTPYYVG